MKTLFWVCHIRGSGTLCRSLLRSSGSLIRSSNPQKLSKIIFLLVLKKEVNSNIVMDRKELVTYVSNKWWREKQTTDPKGYELERLIDDYINEFNLRYPGHSVVEDIANDIRDNVVGKLNNKLRNEQELDQQRLIEMQIKYNKAKEETEKRARTNKNKITSVEKFRTKIMEGLSNESINELFDYYLSLWDELHGDMERSFGPEPRSGKPRPRTPRKKPFKDLVNEFVINHPDELLTPEEFAKVSKDWNRDRTREKAYDYYKDKFFQLPGSTINIAEPKNINKLGFKGKDKYMFGKRSYEMNPTSNEITNYFPLKENLKKYGLHKVAPRGTYIIDLMFVGELVYLVAINVNTRYGMIELTNIANEDGEVLKQDTKSKISFLRTLDKMIREVRLSNPIKHLNGDGEGAFKSNLSLEFYRQRGITFHPAPRMKIENKKKKKGYKTEPLHSSLALVDRLIRTLRDMAFNAGYPLTPLVLKEMMRQYNNAPHSTLSKWIGFPCSPLMVQQDKNKEEYIVMKIMKDNALNGLSDGFNLPIGAIVKVYNEKDVLGKRRRIYKEGKIIGKNGLLYKVMTGLGEEVVPRYKLTSIF